MTAAPTEEEEAAEQEATEASDMGEKADEMVIELRLSECSATMYVFEFLTHCFVG